MTVITNANARKERNGAKIQTKGIFQQEIKSLNITLKQLVKQDKPKAATLNGYAYLYFPNNDILVYIETNFGAIREVKEKQWNYKPQRNQKPPQPDQHKRRFLNIIKTMKKNGIQNELQTLINKNKQTKNYETTQFNNIAIRIIQRKIQK